MAFIFTDTKKYQGWADKLWDCNAYFHAHRFQMAAPNFSKDKLREIFKPENIAFGNPDKPTMQKEIEKELLWSKQAPPKHWTGTR